MNQLVLPAIILQHLGVDVFDNVMQMHGRVYRDVQGRRTVQVMFGGDSYFIKQHFGVGWKEIFKSFISFKIPILGALTEVNAIKKLGEIGVATTPLVGYGVKGFNPATQQSFIVTKDLGDIISLEDLCASWKVNPPEASFKRRLIIAVAELAQNLHKNGLNHRDFYLCHLCLDAQALKQDQIKIYLIDLHRMLISAKPALKATMKDIAGLYFSSMDAELTTRDYLRFKHHYAKGFSEITASFWMDISSRANKLYAKFHSEKFQNKLVAERARLN